MTPSAQESENEKQTPDEGLKGEKKEDLPDQPPPVEDKPREGRKKIAISFNLQLDKYYCILGFDFFVLNILLKCTFKMALRAAAVQNCFFSTLKRTP